MKKDDFDILVGIDIKLLKRTMYEDMGERIDWERMELRLGRLAREMFERKIEQRLIKALETKLNEPTPKPKVKGK